jgi:hypothetical protein
MATMSAYADIQTSSAMWNPHRLVSWPKAPKARRREFSRQWSSIHLEVEHEHDREEAEEDRAADGQRVAGGGPFAQGMS